jgi:hypothetical protein
MILNYNDIRNVRPIAENINDPARLEPYIREAETLRLVDAIGANLYRWLDETDFSGLGPFQYGDVSITKDQYTAVMEGGYYDGGRSEGLKIAIAYTAYSRFIVNNPINPTAFGVRYKDGEFSTRVEDNIIIRSSNEARNIGEAYLEKAINHLKALQLLTPCTEYKESPARKIIIGRNKL